MVILYIFVGLGMFEVFVAVFNVGVVLVLRVQLIVQKVCKSVTSSFCCLRSKTALDD